MAQKRLTKQERKEVRQLRDLRQNGKRQTWQDKRDDE